MRAGFLGPAGTISEAALDSADDTLERVSLGTLRDVVLAVQNGKVERALVPIENALQGGVDPILDTLALEAPDVALIGELVHPVEHCLIGHERLALERITAVLSNAQALGQCSRWLAEHVPNAMALPVASTADGVRIVAGEGPDSTRAAIGTPLAARSYGGVVLRAGIEDEPGNATRFAWLAPASDAPPPPAPDVAARTALVFWGTGDDAPGWLVDCLKAFATRGVNLTRIESRPLRRGLGHYMFFVDVDDTLAAAPVAAAVDDLRAHAGVVRVLGSFPAAPH